MAVRQFLYQDSIIGSIHDLVERQAAELDLSKKGDQDQMIHFLCAASDVLEAIGIPADGITIALGEFSGWVGVEDPAPVPCAICEDPAIGLVQLPSGDYRLSCSRHAIIALEGSH